MKTVFKSIFNCAGGVTVTAVLGMALAFRCSPAWAKDYWTPKALLAQQFHDSERVGYVRIKLDAQQRARVEARLGRKLPKTEYTFFVASTHGRPDGFALFDEQLGQHEPISFATFFDVNGHITRVEVVTYREPFGDGIRAARFRDQFVGRTATSHFRPGTDIDAISGATISSRSLCIGVARAAALFEEAIHHKGPAALALR